MDIQVLGQLIASLGFPIVACCGLFWFVNKQEVRRKEEMDGLKETLAENTAVLSSLKDLIQILVKEKTEK